MSSGNKVQSWNDGGFLELQQRKGCLFPGAGIGYSRKAGEGSDWKFIAVSIQSPGSVFHSKEKQECVFTEGESLDCGSGKTSPVFQPGLRVGKGNLAWDGGMETWVLFPEPGCSLLWVKLPAEPWKTSRMQRQEWSHWSPGSASTGWIYPWSWNYHRRCSAAWSGGC